MRAAFRALALRDDALRRRAAVFAWLESAHGLERRAIRTDYRFPDVETAAAITGFFFGDAFGARVRREGWSRVPECTGLWSTRTAAT